MRRHKFLVFVLQLQQLCPQMRHLLPSLTVGGKMWDKQAVRGCIMGPRGGCVESRFNVDTACMHQAIPEICILYSQPISLSVQIDVYTSVYMEMDMRVYITYNIYMQCVRVSVCVV